jgi:hypothetical protein
MEEKREKEDGMEERGGKFSVRRICVYVYRERKTGRDYKGKYSTT